MARHRCGSDSRPPDVGALPLGPAAEALRAFQAARDVLGEELGLDPGPELQCRSKGRSSARIRPCSCRPGHVRERPAAARTSRWPQPLHRAGGGSCGPRSAGGCPPARDDRRAGGRREDAARRSWPGPSWSTIRSSWSSLPSGDPAAVRDRGGGRHRAPGGRARSRVTRRPASTDWSSTSPTGRRSWSWTTASTSSASRPARSWQTARALPAAARARDEPRGARARRANHLAGAPTRHRGCGRPLHRPRRAPSERWMGRSAPRPWSRIRSARGLDGLPLAIELAAADVA